MGNSSSVTDQPTLSFATEVVPCVAPALIVRHSELLLWAAPYVDADPTMSAALRAFCSRFRDVDRQATADLIVDVADFYLTYAQMLAMPARELIHPDEMRRLLDTRTRILLLTDEMRIKTFALHRDATLRSDVSAVRGCLTSCVAALFNKFGMADAVETYYPRPHSRFGTNMT